jgi:hypothetical protein
VPNYRQLHEESLAENRPDLYRDLKRSGELKAHLNSVQRDAQDLHARLRTQLAERHPFNPVEWKNNREAWEGWLDRTVQEIVLSDRVLVPDEETERAQTEGSTE